MARNVRNYSSHEDVMMIYLFHLSIVTHMDSSCLQQLTTVVADPGFGQGGAKNFFPRFCRCSEAKSGEESKQYNISI